MAVNGFATSWKNMTSGVSKGSTLGALLFLINIIDLPQSCRTAEVILFADDKDVAAIGTNSALQRS